GFCVQCGTPLTFDYGGPIEVAAGAFDDPNVVPPTIQVNPADKQPFFDGICTLPVRAAGAEPKAEAFKASIVSHQHPDHDTVQWPPQEAH
ncbi:MAG: GFA family protein, partial [Pseudolabrys sp.]